MLTGLIGFIVATIMLRPRKLEDTRNDYGTPDFPYCDWKMVGGMIATGEESKGRYSVEEVQLYHLRIPDTKIFFVIDHGFEALQGPMQAICVYHPNTKVFDPDLKHLRMLIQGLRYELKSPDELLQLAGEVAPLWYGSKPSHHKVITQCGITASGNFPVTKEILDYRGQNGMLVNYYAELGPWQDIVNTTVVLLEGKLTITIAPVILTPRFYQ